jgi:4-amino-4-deoxy-L-arabinose transferase-like glycosyltransferase
MQQEQNKFRQRIFWLVVGATLLGAALRLYQLAWLPISSGFDPAYYGLDALAILDGEFPVYLATNYGREVLFSYLVAAIYAAIGLSDFGIHLGAAFVGILTIPMTFVVAGELLRFSEAQVVRRWGPVLAAYVLAVSYWHLVWSRFGVRAILAPLFVSLTLYLLLRALRRGNERDFFLAGLAAGASLYTYQIGQLVPFLVLAVLFIFWWAGRRAQRPFITRSSLAWLVLSFLVVALPLALYAWQEPQAFNQRVRDVAVVETAQPLVEQLGTLAERFVILARFFSVEGDTHGMWSVGRLPGLNALLLAGFLLGLLVVIWSWRKPLAQVILAWLIIMLAPAILAGSGAVSKRALGVLPLVAILIALGYTSLIAIMRARDVQARTWKAAAALLLGGVLLFSLYDTVNNYFVIWAQDKDKDGRFDPHLSEMGTYIATLPEGTQIYLSADAPNHPNMLLHSRLRTAGDDVRGYNGWRCFVYPAQTLSDTSYVLSEENSINHLRQFYPAGTLQTGDLSNAYGYEDYYAAYHIPAGETAAAGPQIPLDVSWDNQIKLLGYDLSQEEVTPGEEVKLALYWSPLQQMETRYTAFVHLLGPQNPQTGSPIWGQKDKEPCHGFYPTAVWRDGEIIRDEVSFEVAADAPPGSYDLAVGFYTWPDFQRLPVGEADSLTLRQIRVRAGGS